MSVVVTACVRSTTGGYVFSGVCLLTWGDTPWEDTPPIPGPGQEDGVIPTHPPPVQVRAGYPWAEMDTPVQVRMGYPTTWDGVQPALAEMGYSPPPHLGGVHPPLSSLK